MERQARDIVHSIRLPAWACLGVGVGVGVVSVLLLVVESAFTCLDPTKVWDRSSAAQRPKTHGDANPQLRRTKPQAGTLPAENHVGA